MTHSAFRLDTVPVNPELQGRSYPATSPYLVGREKVREFARAVLATSPLNLDPEAARAAGYADVVAPPTFPVVVQEHTLAAAARRPGRRHRLLAASCTATSGSRYTRPIVAGDELTATLTVTSVKTLGGHSMVTAESAIADATGAHVVTAISTLVVRGDE